MKKNNEQTTTKKSQITKGILGLLIITVFVIIIVLLTKVFTKNKNISTKLEDLEKADYLVAERKALQDIAIESNAGILKTSELICNAKEVIDNSIVLVVCNTNKEELIKYYGSKKIYYAYLKTGENSYKHYISKDKEETLIKIK